jgi:membrane-bound ClpP family serine protease
MKHGGSIMTDYAEKLLRWISRSLAAILFLLWGAFFIEHMGYFFTQPGPPFFVYAAQFFHLTLLVGYLVSLRWEAPGTILILIGAIVFFAIIQATTGIIFCLISIIPAVLFVVLRFWTGRWDGPTRHKKHPVASADGVS